MSRCLTSDHLSSSYVNVLILFGDSMKRRSSLWQLRCLKGNFALKFLKDCRCVLLFEMENSFFSLFHCCVNTFACSPASSHLCRYRRPDGPLPQNVVHARAVTSHCVSVRRRSTAGFGYIDTMADITLNIELPAGRLRHTE